MASIVGASPVAILAGARPNFMKVAPLLRAFREEESLRPILIHTGQHYDESMSGQFFRELSIPAPDHHLAAGSGTHAEQTANIMLRLEPVLLLDRPAALVVVGDVNGTVAGALVASKLGIPVIHAEAGLRSFDRGMPEELNRLVTDALSDLLLITEESGRVNLLREGKSADQIVLVGNLMIDSLKAHLGAALESDIRQRLGLPASAFYGLVTLHRPANVDNPEQFAKIWKALHGIAESLPLYWPMHPRTRARMQANGINTKGGIHFIEPLGYYDFLCLQAQATVILTDSGGVQEESTALGVPCLTLRNNTERPVTVECGTNRLAGTTTESILAAWQEYLRDAEHRPESSDRKSPPFWDGKAGERCREAIKQFLGFPFHNLPHEPAWKDG